MPSSPDAPGDVPGLLADLGARPWQIEVAAPILVDALAQREALEIPEEDSAESTESAE